ncbi:unnamed protein product [Lactuca saligna]|uniref:VAL1-3 N-terminal zinc finger domain-containing protein n=1 Tax=Lactuca saligna TaxID=75948 RepID=A0AA36A306_LACSI|nr:unnamed protein product [Lactuca saligna]
MASSSSNKSCLYCKDSSSDCFSNGWKLRNGEFAQLCNRCSHLYNTGRFCVTFHSKENGWRNCNSCGKFVHCGCIMSLGEYSLSDFHGVICTDCSRTECISQESESLIPLFEKVLTASDTGTKLGRFIIPKEHAEVKKGKEFTDHFPEVNDPQGIPMSVLDTAGDTVAFCARESDRKFVMDVRKSG